MIIMRYKGEHFLDCGGRPNIKTIGTFLKEKAMKYGMKIPESGFLPYLKDVPNEETCLVKSYHFCMYQVRYKGFFFYPGWEKEHEVEIATNEKNLALQFGLEPHGDPRGSLPYRRWVPRDETTPMIDVNEDLGYVISDPGGGPICYIVDSNKTHLLVKTNQYRGNIESRRKYNRKERWEERSDGWFYQWLPKEKVYVYKDHDEPFRY